MLQKDDEKYKYEAQAASHYDGIFISDDDLPVSDRNATRSSARYPTESKGEVISRYAKSYTGRVKNKGARGRLTTQTQSQ